MTSLLGSLLLVALLLVAGTGLASHAAYQPDLAHNAIVPAGRDVQPLVFGWPASPAWLYRVTQGLHVTVGIVAVPLLLAKLWSVLPRLFGWPPLRSPAHALERLSLVALVGGGLFQFATGIVNVQVYYPFHFNFVVAHYYGAWVFVVALVLHVGVKLPVMRRAVRERGALAPLLDDVAHTRPEPYEPDGLAPPQPGPPTLSRRGLLGLTGAAMGALAVTTAGQSIGGPLRRLAVLAPRGGPLGDGPNDFPVNKTAATARVTPAMVGSGYRLELRGARTVRLSREELLALPQTAVRLPIACVEGWSVQRTWSGVRIADLAALCGGRGPVLVESLQPHGVLSRASLGAGQLDSPQSLLALRVEGADLSLDHGFPARVVVPALPGVHCTKWVGRMTFAEAA